MNRFVPVLNQKNRSFKQWSEAKYLQKRAHMAKKIILVSLLWVLIFAYLVSPFSRAEIRTISGNMKVLKSEDLYEIGEFSSSSYWWSVNTNEIERKLTNYDYIKSATVSQTPIGLQINIDEISLIGTNGDIDNTIYYLSNGESKYKSTVVFNDINDYDEKHLLVPEESGVPIIDKIGINTDKYRTLCSQMGRIPSTLLSEIESISLNSNFTEFTAIDVEINKDAYDIDSNLNLIIDVAYFEAHITSTTINTICQYIKTNAPAKIDDKYCYVVLDTTLNETTCYPCIAN